ncbi:hypothetical protein Psuf_020170 [Phytohabitans suffuscus]|uniref:PBP domain-containing protein n=1 Tax=Phytohabitans suffuscus TaxID=624315 RepID=A0A6F8YEZ1_9ACTN|nr:hypothetical protein [Phytohabitans suffuscus]BCB84704.1 hypothetical protein Psuf_020170 [Phytohabitans suffuscus]
MYQTGNPQTAGGVTYDPVDVSNPADVPAAGATAIHLLVPQSGSGTRSFFASAMGISATSLPAWVKDTFVPTAGGAAQSVQEHDGTAVALDRNALMPYSIAQWLAQESHPAIDRRNGARLRNVGTLSPTDATGLRLNTSWHPTLLREVYNVIPFAATTASTGTSYLNDLWKIFVGNNALFGICSSSRITEYGFGRLSTTRCGQVDPALRAYDSTQW